MVSPNTALLFLIAKWGAYLDSARPNQTAVSQPLGLNVDTIVGVLSTQSICDTATDPVS